jgi:ubiquinone/menaquinone biosynthesis C-methylase UbiE
VEVAAEIKLFMKDNFSSQSDKYAQFRPSYPDTLFRYLLSIVPATDTAWDCGTGNGQVARMLAQSFKKVAATDISQQQIDNAFVHERIEYSVQPAEKTNFPDNSFDLIAVAQAIHWFEFDAFYKEATRTIRNNGVLAIVGYGLIRLIPSVNSVMDSFYRDVVGPYWDKERKYIDENYQTIPFPFEEIPSPPFENILQWTFEHLIGYIGTWSAVKHYQKATGTNPIDLVRDDLKKAWGEEEMWVGRLPILLRIARIVK